MITGPGGYLQWVEYDPMSFKVISTDVSLKRAANEQYVDIIRGSQGITTKLVLAFSILCQARLSLLQMAFPSPLALEGCWIRADLFRFLPSST